MANSKPWYLFQQLKLQISLTTNLLYLKILFNIVKEVSKGVNVCFRILQSDK